MSAQEAPELLKCQTWVTVTGNIDVQTLIKKLIVRTGKHAELWPKTLTRKEKTKPVKAKNNDKQKSSEICRSQQSTSTTCHNVEVLVRLISAISSETCLRWTTARLVLDGSDITAAATAQPSMSVAPYYCYGASSQYKDAASDEEIDQVKDAYVNSLQIFSDDNVHGCLIM